MPKRAASDVADGELWTHAPPGTPLAHVANEYSIADMAIFPWCRLYQRQRQNIEDFPNVQRWFDTVAARPAVAKDMSRLEDKAGDFDEESWLCLFGAERRR
jgi:GSH-dependent disulfide-bond oxidoreductase